MENSESGIDSVVNVIFEKCNDDGGRMETDKVMELISSYIGDRTEYFSLKQMVDDHSTDDTINQSDLKIVLLRWMKNVKPGTDQCIEDISFKSESSARYLSNSMESPASKDYKEIVNALKDQVADKEHVIANMKTQLDEVSLQLQQQDEVINALTVEGDRLNDRLSIVHSENISMKESNQECEELAESLSVVNEKLKKIEHDYEVLKKENSQLQQSIIVLNDEKNKLLSQLSEFKHDKVEGLKLLATAEFNAEHWKREYYDVSEKLIELKEDCRYLSDSKYYLELELNNVLNKSNKKVNSHMSSLDYETYLDSVSNGVNPVNVDGRLNLATSTPCSNVSLMQEINEISSILPVSKEETKTIDARTYTMIDTSCDSSSAVETFDPLTLELKKLSSIEKSLIQEIHNLNILIADMKLYHTTLEMECLRLNSSLDKITTKYKILNVAYKMKTTNVNASGLTNPRNNRPRFGTMFTRMFLSIVLLLCTLIFIVFHLSSKYCNAVKKNATVIPWKWITFEEFLNFLLTLRYCESPSVF